MSSCLSLKCSSRGGEWSFKKHESRKIFAKFHLSCSLFLVVLCISQSWFFLKAKKVSKYGSVLYFFMQALKWFLKVSESEWLELALKTLWSISLATEKIKMLQASKEKWILLSHKVLHIYLWPLLVLCLL